MCKIVNMRISKPRREMYKQSIKGLVVVRPKITNMEIADELGIHRNTVTKLLDEVRAENAEWVNKRWKRLLNDVTEIAQHKDKQLSKLWDDSYWSGTRRPSQLVAITKASWIITKELYRLHLEYMGIRENPNSLVQINFSR